MPTKEIITKQLRETSIQISKQIDSVYDREIDEITEELAMAYKQLLEIINNKNSIKISDNDFLSATMLWTTCNTILAGLDLFRRGYSIEHLMLLRNSLEIMASAYVIHIDQQKYLLICNNQNKFNSNENISVAKKIVPFIGPMYGLLSNAFTHVSLFHTMPHNSDTPFCIGGLYDPKNQQYNPLVLSMFITTTEFINTFIELIFCNHISTIRYWKPIDGDSLKYEPEKKIRDRQNNMLQKINDILKNQK